MAFADSARRKGPRKKFTTCCACHKICILRLTKCCACHEICTSRFTKFGACREICPSLRGSQSAVPATKSTLRGSQSAVPAMRSALPCSQSAAPATKSALQDSHAAALTRPFAARTCPKTKRQLSRETPPISEKLRFTAPVTRSEHVEDHHRVQSAAPATKSALGSTPAPIPCGCHEKPLLDRQSTRFPLRLPENARSTTTRAQSKCTSRISKNNSDMAGPDRATPRLNTGPVWGNIYYIYSLNKYFSPCVFGDCIPMLIPMKSHGSGITLHKT